MGDIIIKQFANPADFIDPLFRMEQKVFDSALSKDIILKELNGRKAIVGLLAFYNDTPCGYKIGFEHSPEIFYSWVGGVLPEFRGRGIAKKLLEAQHQIAKDLGYKYVRTSTKNKYREMLLLNIKAGFDITGVQKKLKEVEHSIILEKEL